MEEACGIFGIFGKDPQRTPVGSTKSYHGHLLGATAGLEAVITVQAIRAGVVPANINVFERDPALPPAYLPLEPVQKGIKVALSNSFGFGGHNSSLLLGAA